MAYAENTTVSVERSRAEIEGILSRYGAESFAYATQPGIAIIGFQIIDSTGTKLSVRMTLPLPRKSEERFTHRKRYQNIVENDPATVHKLWEQACRSAWRSLFLVVKAKLEACAAGISTVEREFLADVMLSTGRTIGEEVAPTIRQISESGKLPRLLPAAP